MNFNFEKNGYKNSSAHELLHFMAKNDVKGFDWFKNLTLFLAMKR